MKVLYFHLHRRADFRLRIPLSCGDNLMSIEKGFFINESRELRARSTEEFKEVFLS